VEPAVRKLFDEKMALQRRRRELNRREAAIDTALEILGITAKEEAMARGYMRAAKLEEEYISNLPFKDKSLPDACLTVVNDHQGMGLDKKQVEYALALGGYPFDAKDPTNSVEVTLRKLASDGRCDVIKGSGTLMSRYRSLAGVPTGSAFDIEATRRGNTDEIDDSNSRATKT
jgi:hypothetical protein